MILPGGVLVSGLSPEQEMFLQKRGQFVIRYCRAKSWPEDFEKLSMEQVLEIRNQAGWKTPE